MRFSIFQFIAVLLLSTAPSRLLPAADLIDPERRVVWQGNVGIPNGIPVRKTIGRNAKTDDHALGDGQADDRAAIQSAIDNTPAGQVCFLPAGTYRVQGTLFMRTGVVLRGAGPGQTIINSEISVASPCISVTGNRSADVVATIVGNPSKGDTSVTIDTAFNPGYGIQAGWYATIDSTNSPPFSIHGQEGDCTYCSREAGARINGQVVQITSITGGGKVFNFTPPLYADHTSGNQLFVTSIPGQAVNTANNVGIEDLTIDEINGKANYTVEFIRASQSWMKNVESKHAVTAHVHFLQSSQCQVFHCYFHGVHGSSSGSSYGVLTEYQSSAMLFEDNLFQDVRGAFLIGGGSGGGVIAYNYVDSQTNAVAAQLIDDFAAHSSGASMWLCEGNVWFKMGADWIHGPTFANTFFRSWAKGAIPGITTSNNRAVFLDANSTKYNVVGNVLGNPVTLWEAYEVATPDDRSFSSSYIFALGYNTDGLNTPGDPSVKETLFRHGNYDFAQKKVTWQEGVSQDLPPSLYLSSKPKWWPMKLSWPPIGPDRTPMTGLIPAQTRLIAPVAPAGLEASPSSGTNP